METTCTGTWKDEYAVLNGNLVGPMVRCDGCGERMLVQNNRAETLSADHRFHSAEDAFVLLTMKHAEAAWA